MYRFIIHYNTHPNLVIMIDLNLIRSPASSYLIPGLVALTSNLSSIQILHNPNPNPFFFLPPLPVTISHISIIYLSFSYLGHHPGRW